MKEKDVNSKLVMSLREIGMHAYKIPDNMGMAARFSPDKPYDTFALGNNFIAIEAKLIKPKGKSNFKSFGFDHFETQQLPALRDANNKLHGIGVVALITWKPRAIHRINFINIETIYTAIANGKTSYLGKEIEAFDTYYECKKNRYQLPSNLESILLRQKRKANEINKQNSRKVRQVPERETAH